MVGGTCPKALIAASANGCMAVVELLLEHGAKVDCPAEISNGSALYRASGRGHEKIVGFLLDYGADPNFQSGHYGGPLQAASDSHFKGVVRLLLDKGARVNICRSGQRDALGIASTRGDEQIVRMLLEHGADTIDNALFWACSRGQESAVSILLERTAKIVTPNGPSFPKAIQAACWTDRANMIRPLLNHVAEVNLQEAFRDNALLEASRYACGEVLQLLLENGAKIKYHAPLEASQVMNGKTVIQHLPEYQQYREDAVGYGYTDKDYEIRVIDDIFSRAEIGDTQALIGNPLHMACLVPTLPLFYPSHVCEAQSDFF
jgi:ankyrin repeat protein